MLRVLLCISIGSNIVWHYADAHYAVNSKVRFKTKLFKMASELVLDVEFKSTVSNQFKKAFEGSPGFQQAQATYVVRRIYSKMLLIYFDSVENFDSYDYHKLILHLKEIQQLRMNVDNLVRMFEEKEEQHTRLKTITRTGKETNLRTANREDDKRTKEIEWQKQKAYAERKKLEWSFAHGSPNINPNINDFKKRDAFEDGFASDLIN